MKEQGGVQTEKKPAETSIFPGRVLAGREGIEGGSRKKRGRSVPGRASKNSSDGERGQNSSPTGGESVAISVLEEKVVNSMMGG